MLDAIETFLLDRSVESLDVSLIVFLPYTAVPVMDIFFKESVREASGELTPMICLDHGEDERCFLLCSPREPRASVCTDSLHHLGICPA